LEILPELTIALARVIKHRNLAGVEFNSAVWAFDADCAEIHCAQVSIRVWHHSVILTNSGTSWHVLDVACDLIEIFLFLFALIGVGELLL
jgi:hypothetical protein